jgi:hypothetical protein
MVVSVALLLSLPGAGHVNDVGLQRYLCLKPEAVDFASAFSRLVAAPRSSPSWSGKIPALVVVPHSSVGGERNPSPSQSRQTDIYRSGQCMRHANQKVRDGAGSGNLTDKT